jgi:hypothetical protein
VKTAKLLPTALTLTIATQPLTNVGPRVVLLLLIVMVIWFALMDNVNNIILFGMLHVKMMVTVVVMLSLVIKDYAGVLTVLKVLNQMDNFQIQQLILLLPILLLLL